jgi:hypothetical protein
MTAGATTAGVIDATDARYSYYRPRERDCFRDWDGALVCRRY